MLTLGRQQEEWILIGDDTEVKVFQISGEKVRLGIRAPKGVPIRRRELKKIRPKTPSDETKTGGWLVLSRRSGESIIIGDDITVTVASISGSRMRIGIDAPSILRVLRGELVPRPVAA